MPALRCWCQCVEGMPALGSRFGQAPLARLALDRGHKLLKTGLCVQVYADRGVVDGVVIQYRPDSAASDAPRREFRQSFEVRYRNGASPWLRCFRMAACRLGCGSVVDCPFVSPLNAVSGTTRLIACEQFHHVHGAID